MSLRLASRELVAALYDAGFFGDDVGDSDTIRRVVIDLQVGEVAKVYVEHMADEAQLVAALRAGTLAV